ncbi:MAG: helix-turn-helix domain-containing protein [Deltaproteobacteria bacterium]|nr:helix-turn-helix domain-containing protein [Deltaproteobacteria bacterium]
MLKVSKRTVFRMVQKKKLPAVRIGGQWRIRETQFRQWLDHKEKSDL